MTGCSLDMNGGQGTPWWWVENAYSARRDDTTSRFVISTFQNERCFIAAAVKPVDDALVSTLKMTLPDVGLDKVAELLTARPAGAQSQREFILVEIREASQAQIIVKGAVIPFWIQGQRVKSISFQPCGGGCLEMQRATFSMLPGDYLVTVSKSYLTATRQDWERVATSIRRWSETGCDAFQLRDCLLRTGRRLANEGSSSFADLEGPAVLALRIRRLIPATVWTGPPRDRDLDRQATDQLMAERGLRIICGDTTAQIAARLLGRELRVDQTVSENRTQVPPLSYLEGIDLVTEGVITLRQALVWLQGAETTRDLPRSADAAARLAHMLLGADTIHFIVGRAINPVQIPDEAGRDSSENQASTRAHLVEALVMELRARGKVVSITYL